jgi:hypothetical protein
LEGTSGVGELIQDAELRCLVTLKVISKRYLSDESALLPFLREAREAASLRQARRTRVLSRGGEKDDKGLDRQPLERKTTLFVKLREGKDKTFHSRPLVPSRCRLWS